VIKGAAPPIFLPCSDRLNSLRKYGACLSAAGLLSFVANSAALAPASSQAEPEPSPGGNQQEEAPRFYIHPAARPEALTPSNGWPATENSADWARSLGGPTSNRFSELTQITPDNVAGLEVAWTYHSGDGTGNIQCNPIIVGGVLFTPTPGKNIVAVDAATGREIWRFSPASLIGKDSASPARRGLLYWNGDKETPSRLLFGDGRWLLAIDPATGHPIPSFGEGGKVLVPAGTTVAGAVYQHVLVMPGYGADVYGFDVRNGKALWSFVTRAAPGDFGGDTWSTRESGANCWGGMAMDESRGIAFVATGSPKPNYFGMNHLGDNLFSNCVIALDALTGKRLWHFQEIRHDIWDWDIPAPPNLVTVQRHGRLVDAVAQVTKAGNTLLLDRVTGAPLYDFRLVKVDGHALPGDVTAPFQPAPELPQPFARNAFTEADLPTLPGSREAMLPLFQRANHGAYPSIEEAKPTLLFNIHGGAEWTGAAADSKGFLYVTSNEIPWSITCFRDDDPPPATPPTPGEQTYQTLCIACHGADRRGIGHAPPLRGLRHRMAEEEIRNVIRSGRNGMPALPFVTDEQIRSLTDFLLCKDRQGQALKPTQNASWTFSGFIKAQDPGGYPACSPPWGTLNCINLNTGKIAWSVPLGEYPELRDKGVPTTGQENFGGAAVTTTGLVFASGTRDQKIRAFDAHSGRELWNHALPLHGTAPPSIYQAKGRQFVVVPATGGGKLGGKTGDSWVAFALPPDRGTAR
jgi:quinoprotein glucose dehydrogenase